MYGSCSTSLSFEDEFVRYDDIMSEGEYAVTLCNAQRDLELTIKYALDAMVSIRECINNKNKDINNVSESKNSD